MEEPCCNSKQSWKRIETVADVSAQDCVISLQANMEKMVGKAASTLQDSTCQTPGVRRNGVLEDMLKRHSSAPVYLEMQPKRH